MSYRFLEDGEHPGLIGFAEVALLKERLINAFGCAEMVAGSPLWAAHQVF
jgi:hypothetical protein